MHTKPVAVLVINETHKLWKHKYDQMKEYFSDMERVIIPAQGLCVEEMDVLVKDLVNRGKPIVFASPIPYVVARVAFESGYRQGVMGHPAKFDVWAFSASVRDGYGTAAAVWSLHKIM